VTAIVAESAAAGVRHLMVVQLGPVQEFIAQARRTRDLWFGSHLLSELSRAAAKAAATHGALIFPALGADDPELDPCDTLSRDTGPAVSIANKVVVELTSPLAPRVVAQAIRAAVDTRWRAIADKVRKTYEADLADDIDAVWNEQIGSLVEYAAAWAPIDRDYAAVRCQVEAALGGRRRLRDFALIRHHRDRAPASSLDGGRVSVLAPPGTRRARRADRRLLLGEGESLDAVGVVKRRGGDPKQFLSVMNVAVAPWLRRASTITATAPALDALRRACRDLTVEDDETGVIHRLEPLSRPDLPGAAIFPYNASVLFAPRLPGVFEELGASKDRAAVKARAWEVDHLRRLLTVAGEPPSYVACLVADADQMGLAIDGLHSADAHRELARVLGVFPAKARRIIEQDHDGIAVYAGGDDVLAFVPVCRSVACAEALRTAFASAVGDALDGAHSIDRAAGHTPPVDDARPSAPTLSVGIGVGYILDSMGHLRDLGHRAEKAAKQVPNKNALAVLIDRRSGGEHLWSASWSDDPARRLALDVDLLDRGAGRPAHLPMAKVHELARLLRGFSVPAAPSNARPAERAAPLEPDAGARVLRGEITRILARTHRGATHASEATVDPDTQATAATERATLGLTPEKVGLTLDPNATFIDLHVQLAGWVARLQIAHILGASDPDRTPSAPALDPNPTSEPPPPEERAR
jgi:CRISPR-associated protein Cmr2